MAILINIVLNILLIGPIIASEKCDLTNRPIRSSFLKFSNEITALVADHSESHFAICPLSIWSLLHLVSEGARNKTLDTLKNVLLLPSEECDTQLKTWKNKIYKNTEKVTIKTAKIMIVEGRLNIKKEFRREFTQSKAGYIVTASKKVTETADFINAIVANLTRGVITDAVTPDSLQDKPLMLMDILYFKSAWKSHFEKKHTRVGKFYDGSRKMIGEVNMMVSNNQLRMKYVAEISAKVLEIPYASTRFSMLIMLPRAGVSLKGLLKSLKELNSPKAIFDLGEKFELLVQLPRFKIDFNIKLEKVLSTMGLSDIFSPSANFSGISETRINIKGFSQRTSLEVTEEGTVAAVVSTAEFEDRMGPTTFIADSPFLYMIVDNVRRVPLVIGAYSKPSLY